MHAPAVLIALLACTWSAACDRSEPQETSQPSAPARAHTGELRQRPYLSARREFGVSGKPESLLAADLDGDGARELVAATLHPGGLLYWRAGLASPPATLAVGGYPLKPVALPAGAFGAPREHRPVAVAARETRRLQVLDLCAAEPARALCTFELAGTPRALAGGTLGAGYALAIASDERELTLVREEGEPRSVPIPADFPRCAHVLADASGVLVGYQASQSVALYAVAEDGRTLRAEPELALVLSGFPRDIEEADLDGDGERELAVIGGEHSLWIFGLGQPGGASAWRSAEGRVPSEFRTRAVPLDLEAADFARSGRDDLLAIDFGNLSLELFSQWTAQGPGRVRSFYAGQGPTSLALVDVTRDGVLDVVVANRDASSASFFAGDGSGGVELASSAAAGSFPCAVVGADLDGNGRAEALALCSKDATLAILADSGSGFARRASLPSGPAPRALAAADLDADGKVDAAWIAVDAQGAHVELRFNDGRGSLAPRADQPPIAIGANGDDLAVCDCDADGRADLAIADSEGAALIFVLSSQRKAPALFGAPLRIAQQHAPRALVAWSDATDAAELAVAWSGAGAAGLSRFAVAADPESGIALRELSSVPVSGRPVDIASSDMNDDGARDLAVLALTSDNATSGTVQVFIRRRASDAEHLEALEPSPTGLRPSRLAIGDIDADGSLELLVAAQNSHVLNVWTFQAEGSTRKLQRLWDLGVGLGPLDVAIADANGDGLLDVFSANAFSDDVSLLLNLGR